MLDKSQKELKKQESRRRELSNILNKKEKEIERLESSGINKLVYSVFKRKNNNLDKERQEYDVIKYEYDNCRNIINELQGQIRLYKEQISKYYLLDADYENLLKQKQNLILNQNNDTSNKLLDILHRISELESHTRDLKSAISEGSCVKATLEKVIEYLEDARDWGMWDVIGGGLLATAAKHSKIGKAKEQVKYTQKALKSFNSQLSYINLPQNINIEIGSFATLADYFFDGIIADWFVQGKILKSLDNAKSTHIKTSSILSALQSRLMELSRELDCLKEEMSILIEDV